MAGGVIDGPDGVLLVRNRRRNGSHDWSTPGGVIDEGEGAQDALTREVAEETGLIVPEWRGPVYEVEVEAPEMGWHLTVAVFGAPFRGGELNIDDPDGIVVDAGWYGPEACRQRLSDAPRWVAEPLVSFLDERWDDRRRFRYVVDGDRLDDVRVRHADEGAS